MLLSPRPPEPKVERQGDVTIITLTGLRNPFVESIIGGELDGHTEELAKCHLLVDFTNVEYLGSMELATLIVLHKRLKASGGRLTLFNLSAPVYEVMTATHLDRLLEICREEPIPSPGSTSA